MSLYAELKRRNVLRAGAAYVVAAWLLIQVAETIFPLFGFDDTPARIVVILLAVGFIPAMVVAWAFELTPEGLKKDRDVDRAAAPKSYKILDRLIMLGLALALAYFTFDRFVLAPQREATVAAEARQEGRAEALVESYGEKSIAVLPFADMSPEGDQEYLSDGIAEELLNLLAKVPELRVISRTSSFAFRDQALEAPEIAKRLKVGHVLEGSVRKAGNRIRVTAQLIEARADTHLWSETWDRELEDVFAVQDEIARAVVRSLRSLLLNEGALEVQPPSDTRAYELVLKGRLFNNLNTPDGYRRAQEFFERATEIDPEYAAAWGGLAKSLRQQYDVGLASEEEVFPRIEEALNRALVFDPDNVDALAIRGKMLWQPDVKAARVYWHRAIASNPSDPDAYRWLAFSYSGTDPVKFLEYLQQGHSVNPTSLFVNTQLCTALATLGRLDEALAVLADYREVDTSADFPYGCLIWLNLRTGRPEQAARAFYLAYRANPKTEAYNIFLVMLLNELGDTRLARTWLDEWKHNLGPGYMRRSTDFFPETILLIQERRPEEGVAFLTEAWQAGHESPGVVAYFTLRALHDFERSRQLYEIGFLDEKGEFRGFNPDRFLAPFIDYALTLQRTGEPERANALLGEIRAHIRSLQSQGAVLGSSFEDLDFCLAWVEAVDGNPLDAIRALQRAMRGGYTCPGCLRKFPHFDSLRGLPEFEALVAEMEARRDAWRQRLDDANLLLTPEEARTMDVTDFDPFTQVSE